MIVRSKILSVLSVNALLLAAMVTGTGHRAEATPIIDLGNAGSFAVIGATTITNTGSTVVVGDLGLTPGASLTGFPPGIVTGSIHINDAAAGLAKSDATATYNQLVGFSATSDLSGTNLGARTLLAGVYAYSSNADMTGVLTLDGGGQSDARFVFKITSALTTNGTASFNLINGASADNIWFQVGTSATLGSSSSFAGTLIASESASLNTGATVTGRIFALNGAVTLDSNTINNISAIPEPATYAFIVSGLALFVVVGIRAKNRKAL